MNAILFYTIFTIVNHEIDSFNIFNNFIVCNVKISYYESLNCFGGILMTYNRKINEY
jgi:hypothetical protein